MRVGEGGGERGVRVGGGLGEGGEVAVVEPGVHAGGGELGVPQGAHQQVPVGDRAVHLGALQGGGEPAHGLRARGGVGDGLGEHRVVVDADVVAVGVAGVEADAGGGAALVAGAGEGEAVQGAGLRGPAAAGVLGVQAGLHGVSAWAGRLPGECGALGHGELEGDQVDAEHGLGDGVLDLEAGVHLQEVRPAVRDQELHGARAGVVDRARGAHRERAQLRLQRLGQAGRGCLLDHLLVAALEGAVAGAEGPHRAVRVGEDLHLDMAAALDVRLGEHLPVAEGARGLGARGGQRVVQLVQTPYDPHPAPAAARGGLHEHRQVVRPDLAQGRDAHELLGACLGRHRLDRPGRRPDPHQAGVEDGAREAGVLGQEAVAGVHGVGTGRGGRLHDQLAAQIRLGGRRARQPYGGVGHARVQRVLVGVRVHGDRPDAQFMAGAEDPAGDLAPVGHKDRSDHVGVPHIRKTPKPPRAPS